MPAPPWTRRRFLRAAGGVALALPILEALDVPPARAVTFPKRLVIVFSPNGMPVDYWKPTGTEQSFTLSPVLAPLTAHQDDLVIVSGVDMESSYHGVGDGMHLNGMGHMLTGTELVDSGFGTYWGGGISVDQFIAQAIGGTTRLGSLELGVEDNPATCKSRMSYLGPAQPVPPETSPQKAFDRLFGKSTEDRTAQRKSVLDAVDGDLDTLRKQLGKDDAHKLSAHLDAVREIEKRLAIPASCDASSIALPAGSTFPLAGQAQIDILVRALACDLTRVASLQWSASTSNVVFSWLGISDPHHSLSHTLPTDAPSQMKLMAINRWYAQMFANLLSAMKAVPEGDGTLLDHTLILWCNELGDGEIHARRDMPYVLAGRAGGALKTGRFLQYGGAAAGATHNNLLVSLCNAMGVETQTFGNPAYCTGALDGLLG
ncbi:MAG: DUF1552 domain-containing protein [Byssovorax sp.]